MTGSKKNWWAASTFYLTQCGFFTASNKYGVTATNCEIKQFYHTVYNRQVQNFHCWVLKWYKTEDNQPITNLSFQTEITARKSNFHKCKNP